MDDLKVLITACGTPGFIPLFKQLKKIKERDIHIIGTDMDMNASGKFYVDKFYQVPPASNTDYQQQMIDIIKKENPDIILPESSLEIEKISLISYLYPEYKFMVNDDHVIKFIENKHELYEYLSYVIPENIPEYYAPKNISDFRYFAEKLGYPDKTICFKPFIGKGSRGFRIIDENIDSYDILFNQRPGKNIYMKINEFADIVYDKEFPDILLNEFVEGTEYDCMVLANEDSEALLTTVKVRKKSKYGLSHLSMWNYVRKYQKH